MAAPRPPLALAFLSLACVAAPVEPPGPESREPVGPTLEIALTPADEAERLRLAGILESGARRIEQFFGASFPEPIRVEVLPDRASFTAWFPEEWGMGETACWMVAAGVADGMALLSPRVWEEEACEHDPADPTHVRDLVVHELVHVYHGQHNPTRDFAGAESVGWFAEGLATYASGQLESGHRARAREAVAAGHVPARLEEAWSGPYRYGVAGTLVEWLDARVGREVLFAMLAVTDTRELVALAGADEESILRSWREGLEEKSD